MKVVEIIRRSDRKVIERIGPHDTPTAQKHRRAAEKRHDWELYEVVLTDIDDVEWDEDEAA